MRVVFIGAHGTGKTTLCKEMKSIYNNLHINDGVSRPVKICKDRIGLSSINEQIIINELTFFLWNFYKTVDDLYITRSPLDCVVYSRVFGWNELADECEEKMVAEGILDSDVTWVYLPIEFELENDGVRFMDKELQRKIDNEFNRMIDKYNINVVRLHGDIQNRIEQLKQITNNK